MFRSPYPDVDIPDQALTDVVLGEAAERADDAALVDSVTGPSHLRRASRAGAKRGRGPRGARHSQRRRRGALVAELAGVCGRVPCRRSARRDRDDGESCEHEPRARVPAQRCGREAAHHDRRAPGESARRDRGVAPADRADHDRRRADGARSLARSRATPIRPRSRSIPRWTWWRCRTRPERPASRRA